MTRKNGGVVETCQHMEYARMMERKLVIEGDWYTVQFFKQDDGTMRVELSHNITGKHYKMYPDNLINFEES